MATLSVRARRTKENPYPAMQSPLARWRQKTKLISGRPVASNDQVALRADGSIVVNSGWGWNLVIHWAGFAKKGNDIEKVDAYLKERGYEREGA